MDTQPLPTPVEWSHEILRTRIPAGAAVVDATAGNGFDTCFLAECVGPSGHVYAFDIQDSAIKAARERLACAPQNLIDVCAFYHAGHESMASLLPADLRGKIAAIMFNLGWLPGHDKLCITRTETTLKALQTALEWLAPGGVITVVAYPNHEGGDDESGAVTEWIGGLCAKTLEVRHLRAHYRAGKSPECWAIRKRTSA